MASVGWHSMHATARHRLQPSLAPSFFLMSNVSSASGRMQVTRKQIRETRLHGGWQASLGIIVTRSLGKCSNPAKGFGELVMGMMKVAVRFVCVLCYQIVQMIF